MPSPSESLLQRILATDQAHAWREQLTAGFFDPDAKRHVLDAIRAGLPALVPDLDADGLRQLTAGVLQELCRQASIAARPAAPVPAAGFTPLTGVPLSRRILNDYPYPIARAYTALSGAKSYRKKHPFTMPDSEQVVDDGWYFCRAAAPFGRLPP